MLRVITPLRVAVLSSILIVAIPLSMHVVAGSGLIGGDPAAEQTGVGVLFNLPDLLSYASWAYQAKLGLVTFIDLFTTQPHGRILFNLYFLIVGFLSRVTTIEPLLLMEASLFLLGPAAVAVVLLVARKLKFDAIAQALSIVFVLFGFGPSGLFLILRGAGIERILPSAWLSRALHPGADALYHDLFPLTELVFYPYHSTVFVLLALIVLAAAGLFAPQGEAGTVRRAMLLGTLLLVVGLARPYEAVTLTLVFNLTALFHFLSWPRWPLRKFLVVCCIVDLLAVPPIAYAGLVATLPVWGAFAGKSMEFLAAGPGFFLKGFIVLWSLAGLGLVFAIRDRRSELCFVGIWAMAVVALLCCSPSYGSKFAGGGVLADGLLASYGVGRLFQECSTPAKRRAVTGLIACTIVLMALTPIEVFAYFAKTGAPTVDTDLVAAGRWIRALEGRRIPIVLTDSTAGAVLPGLFGERVYAGHWSLTPDFGERVATLTKAGLDLSAPAGMPYDRGLLARLLHDTKADYLLLRRTAHAAEAIARCGHAAATWEGRRWIAVKLANWACP